MEKNRLNTCQDFPVGKDRMNIYLPRVYREAYRKLYQLSQEANISISRLLGFAVDHWLQCCIEESEEGKIIHIDDDPPPPPVIA